MKSVRLKPQLLFFAVVIALGMGIGSFASSGLRVLKQKEIIDFFSGGQSRTAKLTRTLERHFRDSNRFYPDPQELAQIRQIPAGRWVEGSNFLLLPMNTWKYRFRAQPEDGALVIRGRVHFKNATPDELDQMRLRFFLASQMWTYGMPDGIVDFPVKFDFQVADRAKDAEISVKLVKGTRGPFYKEWNPAWTGVSVSHEIGHMLGLSDEYDELSGKMDACERRSLMCDGYTGSPQAQHYYHILRRVLTPSAKSKTAGAKLSSMDGR